jgi:hypothetical protein
VAESSSLRYFLEQGASYLVDKLKYKKEVINFLIDLLEE